MNHLTIAEIIQLYLSGDNTAGDYIISKYDSLIKRAALDYFSNELDLPIGLGIEDAFQVSRLKVLNDLHRLNLERCPFPHYVISTTHRACSRFIRYAKAQKRDCKRQAEFDEVELLTLEDRTIKPPEQEAIENELMNKVEAKISTLDDVCQAVYQVAIEEKEGIYNSRHPLLRNLGNSSTQRKREKVREAVRGVLEDY